MPYGIVCEHTWNYDGNLCGGYGINEEIYTFESRVLE